MTTWYDVWCATDASAAALRSWRNTERDAARWLRVWGATHLGVADAEAHVQETAEACRIAVQRVWGDRSVVAMEPEQLPDSVRAGMRGAFVHVIGAWSGALDAAIVGTRRVDTTPGAPLDRFVGELVQVSARGIVSGGAYGVDALAHRAALAHGRRAYVVVAGGVVHAGPRVHLDAFRRVVDAGGAIISERAPRMPPTRGAFLRRNRVIAALAQTTVVVRSDVKGGAMSTARHARELQRRLLAVPGAPWDPESRGVNALIADGATACHDASVLAAALGQTTCRIPEPRFTPADEPQRRLLVAVRAGARTAEALCRELALPAADVQRLVLDALLCGALVDGADGLTLAVRLA